MGLKQKILQCRCTEFLTSAEHCNPFERRTNFDGTIFWFYSVFWIPSGTKNYLSNIATMSWYCESRMSECISACCKAKLNELVVQMWKKKRKWGRRLWKGFEKFQNYCTTFSKCSRNILKRALECYVVNNIFWFYLLKSTSFKSEIPVFYKKQMLSSLHCQKLEKKGNKDDTISTNVYTGTKRKHWYNCYHRLAERVPIAFGRSFITLTFKNAIKISKRWFS